VSLWRSNLLYLLCLFVFCFLFALFYGPEAWNIYIIVFFLGTKGPDNILFKEDKRKQKGNGPLAINGTIAFHVLEISRMLR
jgi:hypothetical protein